MKQQKKDLTHSIIERQNILNNLPAIEQIQEFIGIKGFVFEKKIWFAKKQVIEFFEVDRKTIDRALEEHDEELRKNGYEILTGERLKQAKSAYVRDINVPNINDDFGFNKATPKIGLFDFRSFLDLAMLLKESNKAREIRSIILDITIGTIQAKAGGNTKYINKRDLNYLGSAFQSENYRKKFTDTLKECVNMGNMKYPIFTDRIYEIAFQEKAREYKKLLGLSLKENMRDSLYSEVLEVLAGLENGIADMIQSQSKKGQSPLTEEETRKIFTEAENNPFIQPSIHNARRLMASRDLCFRDITHTALEKYISPVSIEDFERFIGEKSKDFEKTLVDTKDVIIRLKNR